MKNRPKGALSASADKVQSAGRDFSLSGRDSILAHITPQEALLLYTLGGGATTNPVTNRLEFGYGAARDGGRNEGAFGKADKDKSDGGGNGKGGRAADTGGGTSSGGKSRAVAAKSMPAVGNATVADHQIATGNINVPSIGAKGMARGNYASQDDAYTDFARAIGAYDTRGTFGRIGDVFAGPFYDEQEPISQNPRTFANGTFHSSTNPLGAAGSIAGMAFGVPALGLAGSLIGDAVGIPHVSHGGYSQPDTGIYSDPGKGFFSGLGLDGFSGNSSNGNYGTNRDNMGRGGALSNPGHLNPQMPGQAPQMNQQTAGTSMPTQQTPEVGLYNQNSYPGQYVGIPGPSQYGYTIPQYNYWR